VRVLSVSLLGMCVELSANRFQKVLFPLIVGSEGITLGD